MLRHDYLPDNLPHRQVQIRQLGEVVAPMLKGERSSNVLIYGKSGTGKTAVTKYVLSYLEAKAKEFCSHVKFSYINCRTSGSEYRVFSLLCQSIGISVPFTGLSVGEVFSRFRLALDSGNFLYMTVLDEADALIKNRGDSLLYELTRINETLQRGKVSIIGISNDLRLKEYLAPRVLSSLSEEELVFGPYDAGELKTILRERADSAFLDSALEDSALGLCAALAAAEHGDARRALDLLRVAGEIAERSGASKVTEEHVREAEKHIEHNRVFHALNNLTLHSKLVVLSIYNLERDGCYRPITGEIYGIYTELCQETNVAPLTQRRVGTLANELDSMGLLNSKVVNMGRYGRTKKIRLEIGRNIVKEVFGKDIRLSRLVENRPLRQS